MIKKRVLGVSFCLLMIPTTMLLSSCSQAVAQNPPLVKLDVANTTLNGKNLSNYAFLSRGNQIALYEKDSNNNFNPMDQNKDKEYSNILNLFVGKTFLDGFNLTSLLVFLSHVYSQEGKPESVFQSNLIFSNTEASLLKEFLFASSNILNQGKSEQIKLYINQINLTPVSTDANTTTKIELIPSLNTELKLNKKKEKIEVKQDQNLWIIGENNQPEIVTTDCFYTNVAYQEVNYKYNMSFKFSYFDPVDTNVNKTNLALTRVKDYINKYNAWGNFGLSDLKHDSFTVNLNFEINIRPEFVVPTYLLLPKTIKELTEQQKNSLVKVTKDTTDQNILKVTYSEENKKKIAPNFAIRYATKSGVASTTTRPEKPTTIVDEFIENKTNLATLNPDEYSNSNAMIQWINKIPTEVTINSSSDFVEYTNQIKQFYNAIQLINVPNNK